MIEKNNLSLKSNNYSIDIQLQSDSGNNQLQPGGRIDSIQESLFCEINEYLESRQSDFDYKFTGKLSNEDNKNIQEIVLRLLEIKPPKVGFDPRDPVVKLNITSMGLRSLKEPAFISRGEPEKNSEGNYVPPYYSVGSVINPEASPEHKLVFLRTKRWGVEPGLEAFRETDLKKGGAFHPVIKKLGLDAKILLENSEPGTKLREKLIQELLKDPKKLNESLYFIKLDYTPPLPGENTVSVPSHRAHNSVHQKNTAGTILEKNLSAISECVANDVNRALGFPSQEAFIMVAKYPDDTEKLLVAAKCVTGTRGEGWSTFEGNIREGTLINNRLVGEDDKGNVKSFRLNNTQLAMAKQAQRLLGDRDGVGSTGANIGYYIGEGGKVQIVKIDPGKALEAAPSYSPQAEQSGPDQLEGKPFGFLRKLWVDLITFFIGQTDRMLVEDLQTDCSFKPHRNTARDLFQIGFDNFSIFDVSLAENIGAVNTIIKNKEDALKVIDEYIEAFKDNPSYKKSLEESKERLQTRINHYETVLANRLNLSDDELTVLENLEKLTSQTTNLAGKRNSPIALNHLAVVSNHRKEWSMTKEGGTYTISFKGKTNHESHLVADRLKKFGVAKNVAVKNKQVSITLSAGDLPAFLESINEDKIAKHKHQYIAGEDGTFKLGGQTYHLQKTNDLKKLADNLTKASGSSLSKAEITSATAILRGSTLLKEKKLVTRLESVSAKKKNLIAQLQAKGLNQSELDPGTPGETLELAEIKKKFREELKKLDDLNIEALLQKVQCFGILRQIT